MNEITDLKKTSLERFFKTCNDEYDSKDIVTKILSIITDLDALGQDIDNLINGFFPVNHYYMIPDLYLLMNVAVNFMNSNNNQVQELTKGMFQYVEYIHSCIIQNAVLFFRSQNKEDKLRSLKYSLGITTGGNKTFYSGDRLEELTSNNGSLFAEFITKGVLVDASGKEYKLHEYIFSGAPRGSVPRDPLNESLIKTTISYKLHKLENYPHNFFKSMCFEYIMDHLEYHFASIHELSDKVDQVRIMVQNSGAQLNKSNAQFNNAMGLIEDEFKQKEQIINDNRQKLLDDLANIKQKKEESTNPDEQDVLDATMDSIQRDLEENDKFMEKVKEETERAVERARLLFAQEKEQALEKYNKEHEKRLEEGKKMDELAGKNKGLRFEMMKLENRVEESNREITSLKEEIKELEGNKYDDEYVKEQVRLALAAQQEEFDKQIEIAKQEAVQRVEKSEELQIAIAAGVEFSVEEKTAEMKYYMCVIDYALGLAPNDKLRNAVFNNHIKTIGLSKGQVISHYTNKLSQSTELVDIKDIYQEIKNTYELLKGPVRVYLKLKPFVPGKDDNNAELFPTHAANQFEIRTKANTGCHIELMSEEPKQVRDTLGPMIEPKNKHTFSRVYYAQDPKGNKTDSQYVFKDSIKETVDNIIPIGGSTIMMAYGPSGSGKTYNLIGDKLTTSSPVYGLIYKVLDYLSTGYNAEPGRDGEGITNITLRSWQYYMRCGSNVDPAEFVTFDSLSPFYDGVRNAIQSNNTSTGDFINNTLNTFFNSGGSQPFIYKYERSEDGGLGDSGNHVTYGTVKYKEIFVDELLSGTDGQSAAFRSLTPLKVVSRFAPSTKVQGLFVDRPISIDPSLIKGIDDQELKLWAKVLNQNSVSEYTPGKSILYNVQNMGTLDRWSKNKQAIKPGDLTMLKLSGDANTVTAVHVESKILLNIITRIVEFGNLTTPTYNDLIRKSNNTSHEINLTPGDPSITDTFTKFYIALIHARPTRATINNPDSSRTHLVINIKIETENGIKSNLRFVDLAGNERADENYYTMREEGNGITASLLVMKELLQAKQRGVNKVTKPQLSDKDKQLFFTSCINKKQENTCEELYKQLLNGFEFSCPKDQRLLNLDEKITTISMYLNLPTYLKYIPPDDKRYEGAQYNQCLAIIDSLYFIKELQEKTAIGGALQDGGVIYKHCYKELKNWETEKAKLSGSVGAFGFVYSHFDFGHLYNQYYFGRVKQRQLLEYGQLKRKKTKRKTITNKKPKTKSKKPKTKSKKPNTKGTTKRKSVTKRRKTR